MSDWPIENRGARLNSIEQEAQCFWRLRSRMISAVVRQTLLQSRLRVALVGVLSVVFWIGLFAIFYEGFYFLGRFIGVAESLHADTVEFIFTIFFGSLTVMLMFSTGIIVYGGLYRSRETTFLLSLPVRAQRIVLFKFQEALLFSSWGFFLLGSPMLLAYGLSVSAPWYYYVMLLPFMVAFAYIPSAIGAILCLLIIHSIPRIRRLVIGLLAIGLLALTGVLIWSVLISPSGNILTAAWFENTINRLEFSKFRLLPSWWLTTGLLEAAHGNAPAAEVSPLGESIRFLTLLLANAMLLHVIMLWVANKVFRPSYSGLLGGLQTGASQRWRRLTARLTPTRDASTPPPVAWIDSLVMLVTGFLPYRMRLLIVKDVRQFRRDPVQWSQFLIFFGLLALYFVNIRRFRYDQNNAGWLNMVSFLNLAVVGLILSTFTTRFIFPMLSLEGRRFWILGLLPIRRDTILWGKFLFAAVGSILPCTSLILLSDLMLRIPWLVLCVHQLTCLLLCVGLSGIAVGLGAKLPDLRERSPSKIAAGFGGTLNLVLSAAYIVAVVLLTALPCHFYVAAGEANLSGAGFDPSRLRMWLILSTSLAILLGIVATWLPLRLGLKAFRELEF